jgi:hypothetical protein
MTILNWEILIIARGGDQPLTHSLSLNLFSPTPQLPKSKHGYLSTTKKSKHGGVSSSVG